jgi:diguanylate cyclase (GGDEF)-like protein/PAS domain S-box-containing protein
MAHGSDPVDFLIPFEHQNDLVFGIDARGTIVYVNRVTVETIGRPHDELVGSNMADLVHPDDLARASEFVAAAQDDVAAAQDEVVRADLRPAIYRVSHAEGTWLPLEVTGSRPVPAGPLAGWMVMVARYPGDYLLHRRVTALLTSGTPLAEVLEVLPEFGHWRHPTEPYAVVYTGPDGEPAVVGSDRAADLCRRFGDSDTPWALAMTTRQAVVCDEQQLPSALRGAAADRGLSECMAVPVHAPDWSWSAVIVTWSTVGGLELFLHRYPIEQMSGALTLVMQWHQHVVDLERAARFDSMTGLANRSTFLRLLERTDRRHDHCDVAVLYIDLDEFKSINDRYGHAAGDAVLSESARRMTDVIRDGDVAARLGGDEFAVLCVDIGSTGQAVAVAERLLERMASPIEVEDHVAVVGVSIGIAVGSVGAGSAELLLERADEAMYIAKRAGRNQWKISGEQDGSALEALDTGT